MPLPLSHVKSSLLSGQGQSSGFFRQKQLREQFAVENGNPHPLEVSTDLAGVDSAARLGGAIVVEWLSSIGVVRPSCRLGRPLGC